MAADGGWERDVVHIINEGYRAWEELKSLLTYKGLGINEMKCLYEGVIVPTAFYGADTCDTRNTERRKENVLDRSVREDWLVSRTDRVRNGEVHRSAGIEKEFRVERIRVLRWFRHVERMDEYHMARRVLMADVREDGYCMGRPRLGWIWRQCGLAQ